MEEYKIAEAIVGEEKISYYRIDGEQYGVKIESSNGDSETLNDVLKNKKEAQKLIELLCKGMVTPITLTDILTDYVDERDFISWHLR